MNDPTTVLTALEGWSGDVTGLARLAGELLAARGLADASTEPTVRVIRDYAQRGIITRAERQGKEAIYGYRQLLELLAARVLIRDGWPLAKIAEHVSHMGEAELRSLIVGARTDSTDSGEGSPALAVARRLRREAHPAPAPAPLSEPSPTSSQFGERAARLSAIQAELREALRKLGLPEDGPAVEQLTLIAVAPWCQVLVESRRLARLTIEEAEEIGRAVTASLLTANRKGHKHD